MSETFDPNSTMMVNLQNSLRGRFKLTALGSGSAFTVGDGNWQSNFLLEDLQSDKKLLIDCGTDARFSLHEHGFKATDITDVYVSHPHADHIGGLEWLAFSTFFIPNQPKPNLIVSRHFVNDLWDSLKGGLSSIEGEITTLHTFFNVNAVSQKGRFTWQGINFQLVQVVHIMNGFEIVPSYGLLFKINEQTVFFTSDTQSNPSQLTKFYGMSDLILHDCEITPYKSGVHAHYTDLRQLPDDVKRKMWLYHYQPITRPDCIADGFQGWIAKGHSFTFI